MGGQKPRRAKHGALKMGENILFERHFLYLHIEQFFKKRRYFVQKLPQKLQIILNFKAL